jgi:cbb3-type cytochrome oxidase subunit 3
MKDVLMFSEQAWLGAVSIVIFVAVFVGALIWTLRPGAKQAYALRAHMPLSDDTPVEALPRHNP